jgi:hypothetical protein
MPIGLSSFWTSRRLKVVEDRDPEDVVERVFRCHVAPGLADDVPDLALVVQLLG